MRKAMRKLKNCLSGANTPRNITAFYTASDDSHFGGAEEEVTLVAPDILLEVREGELNFMVIEPLKTNQSTVEIDRATVPMFWMAFDEDVVTDFIAKASLLDIVRKYAK